MFGKAISLILLCLALAQTGFAASALCAKFHNLPDKFSATVQKFKNGQKDTTSLRQEKKFVIKTAELDEYLKHLEKLYGNRLKNRDKAPEGYRNVTVTQYMNIAKYFDSGKELAAKVRARKYYTEEDNGYVPENQRKLRVNPSLSDKSWLEIKIQHPNYENVVIKPRLLCFDRDIKKIITEDFFDAKEGIRSRLLYLNPNKSADVDLFIEFFTNLYLSPSRRKENMYAITDYGRTSYSIKMQPGPNPGESIDIQMTLDTAVRLTRAKDGARFEPYSKDETVVEVKIPLQYSGLSPKDIQEIPDLVHIRDFIQWLEQRHIKKYPMNKGKMSKMEKRPGPDDEGNYALDYE